MANACGPCIGQWKRETDDPTRKNSIVTSFNRTSFLFSGIIFISNRIGNHTHRRSGVAHYDTESFGIVIGNQTVHQIEADTLVTATQKDRLSAKFIGISRLTIFTVFIFRIILSRKIIIGKLTSLHNRCRFIFFLCIARNREHT